MTPFSTLQQLLLFIQNISTFLIACLVGIESSRGLEGREQGREIGERVSALFHFPFSRSPFPPPPPRHLFAPAIKASFLIGLNPPVSSFFTVTKRFSHTDWSRVIFDKSTDRRNAVCEESTICFFLSCARDSPIKFNGNEHQNIPMLL